MVSPVVATPYPSPGSSLSSRPACTSLGCSGSLAQPAEAVTQQPAQSTYGEKERGLPTEKSEPGALGKGTLHDIPCPPSARLKAQSSQTCYPPPPHPRSMCQMAPVHVPAPPPLQSELLLPSPAMSVCPSSVLSAVTALAKPPLILCSNNGVPPATAHRGPLGF